MALQIIGVGNGAILARGAVPSPVAERMMSARGNRLFVTPDSRDRQHDQPSHHDEMIS